MKKAICVPLLVLTLFSGVLLSAPTFGQQKIINLSSAGGNNFSRSISVSNQDGVKTTNVTENGKKYVIRESDELVSVSFDRTYGPDDMDKLKEQHPDLHMHVTSFPKSTGGAEVSLTISVKVKAEAADVTELAEKHPDAHKIYTRFTKQQGIPKVLFGGGRLGAGLGDKGIIELNGLDAAAAKRIEELKERMEKMRKEVEAGGRPAFGARIKKDAQKSVESDKQSDKQSDKSEQKDSSQQKRQQKSGRIFLNA